MWNFDQTRIGRIAVPPQVPSGFAVFATTRDFDGFLNDESVAALAAVVHERFGLESTLTTCSQVHGATARRAVAAKEWRECDACDALWSDETGVSLGIKVADCLPISMVDPVQSVVANVHSGWRGAVQNIVSGTVDALERETRFDARDALAYLGPSIRVCCFEVGEEVAERFTPQFVDRSRERPHVDLAAYTIDILRARGFNHDHIFDSQLCTRCPGSAFHSFRRDASGSGRNLAVVAQ